MPKVDVYRLVARYYVRLKLAEAAQLALKKGDKEIYLKYQRQITKLKEIDSKG